MLVFLYLITRIICSGGDTLSLQEDPGKLCLNCHNKTIVKDSLMVRNIGQILKTARSIHPPVEDGGCVTCHNPHSDNQRSTLTGKFPSGFYVKATTDNFELCFMCHDDGLLTMRSTQTATNFRNGKKNLHFTHVNGTRAHNCTVCHNVHGSPNDKLVVNTTAFGKWEMKLNFVVDENGGSCATGCHGLKKYSRIVPAIKRLK